MKHSDWFRRGLKGIQRSLQKTLLTRLSACAPPVYSKMPVLKKIMQSRDATFDLGHARNTKKDTELVPVESGRSYLTVFWRVESESGTQQNACRNGIYAIARRENCTESLQNWAISSK
jgi:hypothetical protein